MKGILGRTRISTPAGWLLLVVALAAGLSLLISSGSLWWRNLANAEPTGVDFLSLVTAGRLLWQEPAHLYDLDRQWAVEREILAPHTLPEGVLPYNYPPFLALVYVPLAWLPFPIAYAAVTLLNLLLLAITLRLLVQRLPLAREAVRWLLAIAFCSAAVYVTLVQGQTSLLVLAVLTLVVLDLRDGREVRAGIWAGLLLFKPQLMVVPLIVLAWRRRWRGLLAGLAVVAGLVLLSWALVGSDALREHLSLIQRMAAADGALGIHPLAMHSLRTLTRFLLPAGWDVAAWLGLSSAVGLAVLWCQRPSWPESGSGWVWSMTVLAMLLVTPHLYTHDLAVLLLPCALILASFRSRVPLAAVASLVGLSILPLLTAALWTATSVYWPVMPVVMALAFLLCWQQARAPRSAGTALAVGRTF